MAAGCVRAPPSPNMSGAPKGVAWTLSGHVWCCPGRVRLDIVQWPSATVKKKRKKKKEYQNK